MVKRRINLLLIVLLAMALAACSSAKLPGTTAASTGNQASGSSTQQAPGGDMANQPIESKLAIGTLSLEGTKNAVTAEQAKTLLPLWKAMKSLSSSSTASNDELTALYQQIQDAMTSDQIAAIKALTLKQEDMQALAKKYNVTLNQPQMPQGTPNATALAKRSSSNSGNSGGGPDGGGMPGGGPGGDFGGGMPPDMGGGNASGNQAQASGTKVAPQGTPRAGMGGPRGGGMNSVFVDPLVKLLEERAGA